MTIEEGNKTIAEFMGGKKAVFNISNKEYYKNLPHGRTVMPEDLKYHTSWDWLMPVVEKINEVMKDGNLFTRSLDADLHLFSASVDIFSKREWVWECVVKFITWYNNSITKEVTNNPCAISLPLAV